MKKSVSRKIASTQFYEVKTDDGRFAFACVYTDRREVLDPDDFVDNPSRIRKRLQQVMKCLIEPKDLAAIREACQRAPLSKKLMIVTQPGWSAPGEAGYPAYYAYPDGTIIVPPGLSATDYIPMYEANESAARRGSYRAYISGVSRSIRGQPIPIFLFFFSLASVLQPFTQEIGLFVENVVVELVGRSGAHKSTLTNLLAGSVWGGSAQKLGYANAWNATPNAIEELLPCFNNGLLILDEATLAGQSAQARGEAIFNTIHRISLGKPRRRYGETERAPWSLMALSSSNASLSSFMDYGEYEARAADVRLLSFDCAHSRFGYLHPQSTDDETESPGDSLRSVVTLNHGHVARRFIRYIAGQLAADNDRFKQRLKTYMNRFLDHVRVDRSDETAMRRAKPFALAYACSVFARRAKIIKREEWSNVGKPIAAAYRQFIDQPDPGDPLNAIQEFLERPGVRVLDGDQKRELSDKAFDKIDAFVITVMDKQCLAIPPHSMKRNFPANQPTLLSRKKMLVKNDGNQFKKRIRTREGRTVNDRLYVVDTTQWPTSLRKTLRRVSPK